MENDQLISLIDRLARMETKIDNMASRLDKNEDRLTDIEKAITSPNVDHENRIRKLEKIVWIAMGFAAAGGGAVGGLVSTWIGA
jgi:uncharacterized protein YaaN involved in tellurite resistance